MDVTVSIPDGLKPAVAAAVAARKDKDVQAFVAAAVREALAVWAQQAVQQAQQQQYQANLAAAQQRIQADLDAIGAK